MSTIKEILDKNNWGGSNCDVTTDKASTHNFVGGFYEEAFLPLKNKEVKVLEIGVSSGTSLLLWDEYFKNNTGVYGIDIMDIKSDVIKDINEIKSRDRINIIIKDAYDRQLVETLPFFDVIIDDGPHTLPSMISFIELYLPKLNSKGIMVIEDVQSLDWMPVLIDTFNKNKKETDDYEVVDLRATIGRYDDLMFVVRRK